MAGMPIYSQVVPKSQHRGKSGPKKERPQNLPREFDPLNYNHGGNFQLVNATERVERMEKKEGRRKEDSSRARKIRNENDGKVEAYLRQNQVSMRQQQRHSAVKQAEHRMNLRYRHSAVKQAEHRMNLRSLPLNEVATSRGQERTPTDRRLFPGERDGNREHRRERERDRDRDNLDFDASPLSPNSRDKPSNRAIRKSSSAHRVTEPAIAMDKRRFFCREWAFQKIAHCLEQRPVSKTCGALILGDAGSGKTALCQELSSPQQTPQARQQRALNRRLLARHFLQSNTESSLRPDEFIRSLAMQILSHGLAKLGSSERKSDNRNEHSDNR
ncbi:hypothetical protein O0L34_g12231 [Tuta absoluta]|nr:hypothetical protein O0L34_g12231 [Tuta absoluta]